MPVPLTESFELLSFANDTELARLAAERWLREIETAVQHSATHLVALSGGRIAGKFFRAVVKLARLRAVSFDQVYFFWADERCVPSTDAESNFALAKENLLEPLGISLEHIHRLRGEEPDLSALARAEDELCSLAPLNHARQPVLDLILLGMGEDGHIASLFPEEIVKAKSATGVYQSVLAIKPPPARLTLSYEAIAAARHVWVLISGNGKAAILQNSLQSGSKTPLAQILRLRQSTLILSDIKLPASVERG